MACCTRHAGGYRRSLRLSHGPIQSHGHFRNFDHDSDIKGCTFNCLQHKDHIRISKVRPSNSISKVAESARFPGQPEMHWAAGGRRRASMPRNPAVTFRSADIDRSQASGPPGSSPTLTSRRRCQPLGAARSAAQGHNLLEQPFKLRSVTGTPAPRRSRSATVTVSESASGARGRGGRRPLSSLPVSLIWNLALL